MEPYNYKQVEDAPSSATPAVTASKNPWMKFYPSDWRGDPALRSCSLAARGLWMEMLCIMHEAEPRGHLLINGKPVNERKIANLCGASVDETIELITELEEAGVFDCGEDGVLISRRMVRDTEKAIIDRKNGKGGGNPNLRKGDNPEFNPLVKGEDKAQNPEARYQNPESRYQISESINEDLRASSKSEAATAFRRFWDAWPQKVGKVDAQRAMKKVEQEIEAILAGLERYIRHKPPDRPCMNPATFLNGRRWEDDWEAVGASSAAGARGTKRTLLGDMINANRNNHSAALLRIGSDQPEGGTPEIDGSQRRLGFDR